MKKVEHLIRVVYVSRSLISADLLPGAIRNILSVAAARNRADAITGVLAAVGTLFIQLIEGPEDAIDRLLADIGNDARHTDLKVLLRRVIKARLFPDWTMAGVERADFSGLTTARFQKRVGRLAAAPDARASDFFRLLCSPGLAELATHYADRGEFAANVVFASPRGIWSAALLQNLASAVPTRIGRTTLRHPGTAQRMTLVEYADMPLQDAQRVRAFALTGEELTCALAGVLVDDPALVVLLLSTSDLAEFPRSIAPLFSDPNSWASRATILLVGNAPEKALESMAAEVRRLVSSSVVPLAAQLRDATTIWSACRALLARLAPHERIPETFHARVEIVVPKKPASLKEPSVPAKSFVPAALPPRVDPFAALLGAVEGSLFARIVDTATGHTLLPAQEAADMAAPAASNEEAHFIRALWATPRHLDGAGARDDVVLTTSSHLEVFRPLVGEGSFCVALAVSRDGDQMASVRMKLAEFVALRSPELLAALPRRASDR